MNWIVSPRHPMRGLELQIPTQIEALRSGSVHGQGGFVMRQPLIKSNARECLDE